MKEVYFIFNNMKEAEYYFKNVSLMFKESNANIKATRNPYKLILPRLEKQKTNFIQNILIKLKLMKPKFVENNLEVIFKSKNSNLTGIHDNIYHFLEDEYNIEYLINKIEEIY